MPSARAAAAAVLAATLALSAAYAWKIAPGNAPDERAHTEYVLEIRQEGSLPVWNWPEDPYSYQAVQPPLYYALGALVTQPLRSLPAMAQLRALRLVSALLHLAALALLWRSAARLDGEGRALGPLCVAAAVPMFAFVGASVTNDAAANLAGAALLHFALAPVEVRGGLRPWLLGGLIGLALLSKLTTLPLAAVGLWALWREEAGWRRRGRGAAAALGAAALVCGWFFLRNLCLYGDPTGVAAYHRGYDTDRYAWSELGTWALLYFQSFWGRFGQMTQPLPAPVYWVLAAVSALSAAGWLRRGRELIGRPGRGLLWAALGLAVAQNFAYGFFLSHQPQARHSFVALTAWAVLFWDGLAAWEPERPGARSAAFGVLGAAAALVHWQAWRCL